MTGIQNVPDTIGLIAGLHDEWTAKSGARHQRADGSTNSKVDPCLEGIQSSLFDQIEAELSKAPRHRMISEVESQSQRGIANARFIAVAVLKAEAHDQRNQNSIEVVVRVVSRRHELGQNVHR